MAFATALLILIGVMFLILWSAAGDAKNDY
jgi:hypothetical protein